MIFQPRPTHFLRGKSPEDEVDDFHVKGGRRKEVFNYKQYIYIFLR